MTKTELKLMVRQIMNRVDEAGSGARNVDDWHDEDDNMGAPEGMSYWDWINEAEQNVLNAIEELDI